MNRVKLSLFRTFIWFFLFSTAADAGRLLELSYEGPTPFLELPTLGNYKEFLKFSGKERPVGIVKFEDLSLRVGLSITMSNDWHLKFYSGLKLKAYLYFNVDNNTALFKGMWVRPSFRGKGLSKPLFKYFALFCDEFGLKIATAKIYKPLVSRIVMGLGLVPSEIVCKVLLGTNKENRIPVFPVGFEIENHLIESQGMRLLESCPEGSYCEVFVNTDFTLPADERSQFYFWDQLEKIAGSYYRYVL